MTIPEDGYAAGWRAGAQSIAEGVPRWMATTDGPVGQMIDPGTGLPLFGISGPPELTDWLTSYAKGHNDAISAALKSGEVTVDFRPLLMSRPEVLRAFTEGYLGTLSTDCPRLTAPSGEFVLELRFPR